MLKKVNSITDIVCGDPYWSAVLCMFLEIWQCCVARIVPFAVQKVRLLSGHSLFATQQTVIAKRVPSAQHRASADVLRIRFVRKKNLAYAPG